MGSLVQTRASGNADQDGFGFSADYAGQDVGAVDRSLQVVPVKVDGYFADNGDFGAGGEMISLAD